MIKKLQLAVTSDIHGYLMPTTYRGGEEAVGLAKAASLIRKFRQDRPTILIDNGDLLQGSPLTYYQQRFHPLEPNPVIEAANAAGYDAAVFGNHEFNYGLPALERAVQSSQFPWLAANIYLEDGSHWMKPYVIIEREGVRVGIVGVTNHLVPRWEEPKHIEGLRFEDAFEAASKSLELMKQREKPDVTVLCYHGGFAHDYETGVLLEPRTGENLGYEMCRELDFDILITGHQHRQIAANIFGKSVVQPGSKGVCAGLILLDVEHDEEGAVKAVKHEPKLVYLDEQTPSDQQVVSVSTEMHERTERWLDEQIGEIEGNMLYEDAFDVRVNKHPYIELIQKVQQQVTGAPISCTSLFHDQPGGLPSRVTMRDIVTNYIYPNTLKVLQVTGEQIYAALEQCASYFAVKDGQLTVDDTFMYPKAQPYNYDMWEGIEYSIDVQKPVGERILSVTYQGEPLDPGLQYDVVMNSYRAAGAGNFPYFADCPVLKELQTDMTELLASYFAEHPVIQAACTPNWEIIWK